MPEKPGLLKTRKLVMFLSALAFMLKL